MKALFLYVAIAIIFTLGLIACNKAKYKKPTCNANCITINATFFDSTLLKSFSNQKMNVFVTRSSGIGNSFSKLWEIRTDNNGNVIFDVSFDDIQGTGNLSGHLSFFVCAKGYSDGGSSGNRVDLFVKNNDIGNVVTKKFNLFKK